MEPTERFYKNNPDEIILQFAMPLIATTGEENSFVAGTAFIIGKGLCITAYHVFEEYLALVEASSRSNNGGSVSFGLYGIIHLKGGTLQLNINIKNSWRAKPLDLAVMTFDVPKEWPEDIPWKYPILQLRPPKIGTQIAGFGFANQKLETIIELKRNNLRLSPRTTIGEVLEIHEISRDSVRMPFPCYRVNARFDGGMSGGPVINNSTGEICGVICSSFPANINNQSHDSYVSTLWPILCTKMENQPASDLGVNQYLFIKSFHERLVIASDIGGFRVTEDPSRPSQFRVVMKT